MAGPHVLPVATLGVAHHMVRMPRPLLCTRVHRPPRVAGRHVEPLHRHVLLLLHVGMAVVQRHVLLVLGVQVARDTGVHHAAAAGWDVPHWQQEGRAVRCRQAADPVLSITEDVY